MYQPSRKLDFAGFRCACFRARPRVVECRQCGQQDGHSKPSGHRIRSMWRAQAVSLGKSCWNSSRVWGKYSMRRSCRRGPTCVKRIGMFLHSLRAAHHSGRGEPPDRRRFLRGRPEHLDELNEAGRRGSDQCAPDGRVRGRGLCSRTFGTKLVDDRTVVIEHVVG